jgi:hypothetical protein
VRISYANSSATVSGSAWPAANLQLGTAVQCFVDCLLQVIRRRARSARSEDRELFELLQLLI